MLLNVQDAYVWDFQLVSDVRGGKIPKVMRYISMYTVAYTCTCIPHVHVHVHVQMYRMYMCTCVSNEVNKCYTCVHVYQTRYMYM